MGKGIRNLEKQLRKRFFHPAVDVWDYIIIKN